MATATLEKPADQAPPQKKTFLTTDQLTMPGQKSRTFVAIAQIGQTLEDFMRPDFYKNTNGMHRLAVGDKIEIVSHDLTWEAALRVVGIDWTGKTTETRLIHSAKHAPATINQDASTDFKIEDHQMNGFRVRRVVDDRLLPGVFPSYADARAHIQKDLRVHRVG